MPWSASSAIVAASIKALELVAASHELRGTLFDNAARFRRRMGEEGFVLLDGEHAIVPVMFGDAALAALGISLLLGVGPTPTLLAVPMLVAALAVIAPVLLGALLSGRRPGTLGPASGILVGATALQVAVLVALG